MKDLLILIALLLIVGCAGHLSSFSGSMDNPPDYYTYAGEGYGYPLFKRGKSIFGGLLFSFYDIWKLVRVNRGC